MTKKEVDKIAVRETVLFIENDGDLYRQRVTPFIKNYSRKIKKGTFNEKKAAQGLADHLVKAGIQKYNKEFGQGSIRLNPIERQQAGKLLLHSYKEEICEKAKNKTRFCSRKRD